MSKPVVLQVVLTRDAADFGVAMMLARARSFVAGDGWARSGAWARPRRREP